MFSQQELEQSAKPISINNGSSIGVLVIHGFTSTVASMRYMIDGMSKAGYNVEAPKLTGHGTTPADLNNTKYTSWISDIESALNKLKQNSKQVFVMGLSLGGALTLYLAENHPEISGIICINHASQFPWYQKMALPLLKTFKKYLPAIASDIKDEKESEIAYPLNPLRALSQLFMLTDIVNKNIAKVAMPILIFKSKEDHVVNQKSATFVYNGVSSTDKSLIYLENSYHVATQDNDKDKIIADTVDFITRITK